MKRDLVSIIITTCNGDNKLIRAINSALNQTYKNIEIIIVDDNGKNSTKQKNTESLISRYIKSNKVHYLIHEVNKNGSAARNTGVSYSSGKYIAFLDDDDIYLPERVAKLVKTINIGNNIAAYSDVVFIYNDKPERILQSKINGFTSKDLLLDSSLLGTGSNIFVPRYYYEKINGFDETYTRYQDLEFMIRLLKEGKIVGCNEVLVMKDYTNARFYPQFDDLLSIQNLFYKKNKNIIESLNNNLHTYKLQKRKDLLLSAYISGDGLRINQAWQMLKEDCGELSFREKFNIFQKRVYMQYLRSPFLRKTIHNFRSKRFRNEHKELSGQLSEMILKYSASGNDM